VQGKAGIDWGVYGVPETFVIDQHGVVRHKHTGPLTPEVVRKELLPLIERLNRG
jgi:cytochrome c biogenesis protein CcmG/thiol:disulfide interchange protein DsbE